MARGSARNAGQKGAGAEQAGAILEDRYQQLELALIDAATAALTGGSLPEGAPVVSAETAIKLLTLRTSGKGRGHEGEALPQLDPVELRRKLSGRIAAVRHVTPVAKPGAATAPADRQA